MIHKNFPKFDLNLLERSFIEGDIIDTNLMDGVFNGLFTIFGKNEEEKYYNNENIDDIDDKKK